MVLLFTFTSEFLHFGADKNHYQSGIPQLDVVCVHLVAFGGFLFQCKITCGQFSGQETHLVKWSYYCKTGKTVQGMYHANGFAQIIYSGLLSSLLPFSALLSKPTDTESKAGQYQATTVAPDTSPYNQGQKKYIYMLNLVRQIKSQEQDSSLYVKKL